MNARAMILAAGFGTRLGRVSDRVPKPMLPVCGTPLIRWAVLWLRAQGIREIVINLHHHGEAIVRELGDGTALGVSIAYSHEETILGTGGGLRAARHLLDDGRATPIVVLNGKILFELDLARLLEHHRRRGREATMVVRPDREGIWGATLALDAEGELATFLGQTRPGATPGPEVMFTGIHVLEPRFLDRIPKEGQQCIVRTAYRSLFDDARIGGFEMAGYWWEHSTVERWLLGIENVLAGRVSLPFAEHPLRGVDARAKIEKGAHVVDPVWIGEDVAVEAGASVGPFVQLGRGSRVRGGVSVRNAAVFEGVVVEGDLVGDVAV